MTSPILFISHGGGPLPLLGDRGHQEMVAFISEVTPALGKPAAILVISAHWEATKPTLTSGVAPSLIYDYHGFPKEAYEIDYPASGSPELAEKVAKLLGQTSIDAQLDDERGFDHGLFVPLKLMFPAADIPCVQLSLLNTLRPEEHLKIGRALASLRAENVLIMGSGFSFHNIKEFFAPSTEQTQALNSAFEQWLIDTCASKRYSETKRAQRLIDWENAPAARYCHPREEHLLPLHVCYGAADSAAKQVFQFEIMGKMTSSYLW